MTYFPQRIGVGLGEGVIKLSSVKTWPFSSHCCHQANHRDALKHQDTVPKWIILQSFTKLEERPSHPCHILRIEFELNRFLVLLLWDFRQHVPWPVCLTGAVCWNQSPKWFRWRKRQKIKTKHRAQFYCSPLHWRSSSMFNQTNWLVSDLSALTTVKDRLRQRSIHTKPWEAQHSPLQSA